MERISVFAVDIVWNDCFSRGEISCGCARVIERLRVRNVRGNNRDWMNVTLVVGGSRIVLRDVCGLALEEECELPTENCVMPTTVKEGWHECTLEFEYRSGKTKVQEVVKHAVEVLPDDHICTRMDKAETLRAYIKLSDPEVRRFVSDFTANVTAYDTMGKAQGIYDGLRMLRRKYEAVPRVVRKDYEKIMSPEETLRDGGSCADLSILFASLFYAARLAPVLVLLQQHMMAGCWLSPCPTPPVLTDRDMILHYVEEGKLLLFDCIDVCADYSKPLSEAREDALRHIKSLKTAVVMVNACAREGIEHFGSVHREARQSKVFRCPECKNDKFLPQMLRERSVECPSCGVRIPVPDEFRIGLEPEVPVQPESNAPVVFEQEEPEAEIVEPKPASKPEPEPLPPEMMRSADTAKCSVQGNFAVVTGAPRTAEAVIVPESSSGRPVTKIARMAFTRYKFKAIRLVDSIEEIEQQAFYDCPNLKWVYLPDNLVRLGSSAFGQCAAIEEIYIPKNVRVVSSNAFKGCKALRRAEIAEGVEEIAEGAFADCPALETVQLPSTLKRIGKGAFRNCSKKLELQVPAETVRDGEIF